MPYGLARLLSGPRFGFAGLLAILFIGLKLTAHIDWSWWWVLAPMWFLAATLALFTAGPWPRSNFPIPAASCAWRAATIVPIYYRQAGSQT